MEISNFQLELILKRSAEVATIVALVKTGAIKPYLKKSEAFRRFGRKNVERWIKERMVTLRKDGDHSATWRIDRVEIEVLWHAIELTRMLDMPDSARAP